MKKRKTQYEVNIVHDIIFGIIVWLMMAFIIYVIL